VPSRASIAARAGIRVWRARRSPGRSPGTTLLARQSTPATPSVCSSTASRNIPCTVPKMRVRSATGTSTWPSAILLGRPVVIDISVIVSAASRYVRTSRFGDVRRREAGPSCAYIAP
jgi:hypothetical protein